MVKAKRRKCMVCGRVVHRVFPCKECAKLLCCYCAVHDRCPDCHVTGEELKNDYFKEKYKEKNKTFKDSEFVMPSCNLRPVS